MKFSTASKITDSRDGMTEEEKSLINQRAVPECKALTGCENLIEFGINKCLNIKTEVLAWHC